MSDRALVEAIVKVLDAYPEGLNARGIRRAVLEQTGLRRRPSEITRALASNPDLFVGPFSSGAWRLRSVVEAENIALRKQEPRLSKQEVKPYFADLPPLDSFIAFDLETTGFDPERDQIIQISAVRMTKGQPASATASDGTVLPAVFNEYVRLEGREIPYGLKVKLGFTKHPEWEKQLAVADPVHKVLRRFRNWVGDLPLIAHNARFDHSFLEKAARRITWKIENPVVDSMELACLARPDLRSFRLEKLGQAVGVGGGEEGGLQVERWAAGMGISEFSWTGFHNAVVDVLVLAAIVPRLVAILKRRLSTHPGLADEFQRLLPQAARSLGIRTDLSPRDRSILVRELVEENRATLEVPRTDFIFGSEKVRAVFEDMIQASGLRRRESQLRMVELVSSGLENDKFVVIEAPTGTGKTFAYLVPGLLWSRSKGETVVVSTYTRLLQDQLVEDLEAVRQDLGLEFRSQVLKGMSNYICLERAASVYAQTKVKNLNAEERFAWVYLLSWLSVTREGLLDELSYWAINTFPALSRLVNSLRVERGACTGDRCASSGKCFYRAAYARAKKADIVVMNHALLLSREDWEDKGVPFSRIIIDEAHNLAYFSHLSNRIKS